MKIKPLNQASMDVWYEYNQDEKNLELTERILLLSGSHELSDEDTIKLNDLIDKEKEQLIKAKEEVEIKNKVSKKLHSYLKELETDKRLHTLFSTTCIQHFIEGKYKKPEDVDKHYHEFRSNDIDLDGHEKYNEEYNRILKIEEEINNKLSEDFDDSDFIDIFEVQELNGESCGDEDCVWCPEPNEEERFIADTMLESYNFFNMDDTEAMIKLMTVIIRMQEKLDTGNN